MHIGEYSMNYKLYTLNSFGDERGALVPIENGNNSDFDIKRVFYIYGASSDKVRGMHANKYSKFILISVCGRCKILIDDGNEKTVIELNKPNQALYLDKIYFFSIQYSLPYSFLEHNFFSWLKNYIIFQHSHAFRR